MSFWIQVPAWGQPQNCVFSKKGNDLTTGIVIYRDGGVPSKARMRIGTGTSLQYNIDTGSNFQNSKWVHWCYVRRNNVGYWYRNGIFDNSGEDYGDVSSDQIIWIGYNQTWTTNAFYNLKALRIYNRALSEKEVAELSNEFDVKYVITASDQTWSGISPAKNYTYSIVYSSSSQPTFEIISGELPNTITFNSSTGTFSGKALTDANHTYNLVIRMTGDDLITKDINMTINTSATSTLSVPSPQTFSFITEAEASREINISTESNADVLSFSYEGQPDLGAGCFISRMSDTNRIFIETNGRQTSNQSVSKVFDFWTTYHPEHVQATININVTLNQITVADKELNFYTEDGSASQQVKYTTQNAITPVYTLSGTLPTGITFDTSTGTFTYDGTTTTPASGTVEVTVSSSTGCSAPDTGTFTLNLIEGSKPFPSGLVFYAPLEVNAKELTRNIYLSPSGTINFVEENGIKCFKNTSSQYGTLYTENEGDFSDTENFSISFWMKTDHPYQNSGLFFEIGKISRSNKGALYLKNYFGIRTGIVDGGEERPLGQSEGLPDRKWFHCVLIYEKNKSGYGNYGYIYGYIDGVYKMTSTFSNLKSWTLDFERLTIGSNLQFGEQWKNGCLCAFRYYNRVLTQEEITELSQEFTPTT